MRLYMKVTIIVKHNCNNKYIIGLGLYINNIYNKSADNNNTFNIKSN